jgi:hypothetical protein
VAALVANDQQIATQIAAATERIDNLTFTEASSVDLHAKDGLSAHSNIQAVDHRTFKDAPNPARVRRIAKPTQSYRGI